MQQKTYNLKDFAKRVRSTPETVKTWVNKGLIAPPIEKVFDESHIQQVKNAKAKGMIRKNKRKDYDNLDNCPISIYVIENYATEKYYVGQTNNFNRRKNQHLHYLRSNTHKNKHLQASWNKYGEENFSIYVVDKCSESKKYDFEQKYIDEYDSFYNGYNGSPDAAPNNFSNKYSTYRTNYAEHIDSIRRNPELSKIFDLIESDFEELVRKRVFYTNLSFNEFYSAEAIEEMIDNYQAEFSYGNGLGYDGYEDFVEQFYGC